MRARAARARAARAADRFANPRSPPRAARPAARPSFEPTGDPIEAVTGGRIPLAQLSRGVCDSVARGGEGGSDDGGDHGALEEVAIASGARLVLPGSFNPLHDGHVGMMRAAARKLGVDMAAPGACVFELAIVNADKGALEADEARMRVRQFGERTRPPPPLRARAAAGRARRGPPLRTP